MSMKTRTTRRKFSAKFKAEVAIEALKERETTQDLCRRYDLHATQISQWKNEFLQRSASVFEGHKEKKENEKAEKATDQLYSKIGKLEMENDFLKKSLKKLGRL
ncbi:transposase (plasmid) [Fulvitalea axinellae]|uniref:Transposase n=1 Tax=Fulvitalea axinellae TaxID=1182444 RepID=A0AAU9D8S7_9BACT|nr:transposase [Fulvitalea axinellae]